MAGDSLEKKYQEFIRSFPVEFEVTHMKQMTEEEFKSAFLVIYRLGYCHGSADAHRRETPQGEEK